MTFKNEIGHTVNNKMRDISKNYSPHQPSWRLRNEPHEVTRQNIV